MSSRMIARMLAPFERRLETMLLRAVISRVNDSTTCQTLQVEALDDETFDDVEHFQPYGLSFNPPDDSEVVLLRIGRHSIALAATDRGTRPTDAKKRRRRNLRADRLAGIH